jgi:hypothetical protein
MKKPTFLPLSPDGTRLDPIAYTPVSYTVGTASIDLALHREINYRKPDKSKRWHVSDPVSGIRVSSILNSAGMSQREAIAAATSALNMFLDRFGADEFMFRLSGARSKHPLVA